MNWNRILNYFWKLLLCWAIFLAAFLLEVNLIAFFGVRFSGLWEGMASTIFPLIMGSLAFVFVLTCVSRNVHANWFFRWIMLEMFMWEVGIVGLILKSFLPATTSHDPSLFSTLSVALAVLLPSLVVTALIAYLFRPAQIAISGLNHRRVLSATWRIIAGSIAFPLVCIISRLMAQLFFRDASGLFQLHHSWGLILSLTLIHGSILSAASLPIIKSWQGGKGKLWRVLGGSFWLFPAITTALCAQGLHVSPANILENILVAFGYAGVLVILFSRSKIAADSHIHSQWHKDMVGYAAFFR